jgi:hypothetical protein
MVMRSAIKLAGEEMENCGRGLDITSAFNSENAVIPFLLQVLS